MPRRRLKSPLWVPPGGSQVDFARRWISEQLELDHLVDLTPAGIAAATGVHRHTARTAIRAGPLPFRPGFRPVRRDLVDLVLPARSKILATNLYQRGEPERHHYLPSLKDLAQELGWHRNSVQRALQPARAGGLVVQEVVAVHGNRTYVRRWCLKVGTGIVQKRVRGLSKSGYGDCLKVGTGTSSVQSSPPPPSLNGIPIDLSPPSWARGSFQGGEDARRWAILSSSHVADQLQPFPTRSHIEEILSGAGVSFGRRGLASRLVAEGLTREELQEQLKAVATANVKNKAAVFRTRLVAWLEDRR